MDKSAQYYKPEHSLLQKIVFKVSCARFKHELTYSVVRQRRGWAECDRVNWIWSTNQESFVQQSFYDDVLCTHIERE